jgi:hypothetical protein
MNRLFAAALLAGIAPLAAQAQDRNLDSEPSVGKIVSGSLAGGGTPARFTMTLRAGEAIDLTAAPVSGSDPAVKVFDAANGQLIAENDDSAGSLASNVRLFSEQTKRVRIEVSNAAVGATDAPMRFDLILRPSDYRPKPARDIVLGEELAGTLESSDEQLFRFHGERGQQWTFALSAAADSGLDPAVEVFAGQRPAGEALGRDDDSGGGLDSKLSFIVPENGDYVLRAYGVGTSAGAYTLSAEQTEAAPPPKLEDISLGEPVTGEIAAGARERFYRLSDAAQAALAANPGPVVVEMSFTGESEGALDPIVAVGFETPLGFSSVVSDDDGAGGTNARLTVDSSMLTPTWLESLRIKASGFLETSGGYELKISQPDGE